MRILDTSILVAIHANADVHHANALEIIKAIGADERILLNDYLVNEAATVMMRKYGLVKAKEILEFLTSNSQIVLHHTSPEEFQAAVSRFQGQTGSLSFVDCSILCLSDSMGCPLETFDKNLASELGQSKTAKSPRR